MNRRVLAFSGTKIEFGVYLAMMLEYCLSNPGITIGEFAWREGSGHVV